MFKILLFSALAIGSATLGQRLIHSTQALMAGEMKLATINPYSTQAQQNQQIKGAMEQINQARAGARAPQP